MYKYSPDSVSFQFTHPVRGATLHAPTLAGATSAFQFTHPVRGATRSHSIPYPKRSVSIHAPREGCD